MVRINITIDEDLNERAEAIARRRGISKSALVREGLRAVLPEDDDDPLEAMIGWIDGEPVDDIDEVVYGYKA